MGILDRLERGPRAAISGDLWRKFLTGDGAVTKSGVRVSEEAASACSAVFSCVRVASEDIAKLPLILHRRLPGGGKERATDHPLYTILHDRPNSWQTSFEFRQLMQVHMELWGNAYAFINRVRGEVRELIPIHPDRVTVKQRGDWELEYDVRGDRTRGAQEILHLPGLTMDGPEGLALRRIAREAIGLALATEQHGAQLFASGALFRGVMQHPGVLKSADAAKRMRESFDEARKNHGTVLLEDGVTYNSMSMTAEDSQFLETRKFQVSEIARYFRMPPHKIADLERATFSNIEHQALEYVTDSLMPRQVRWEQRIGLQLLSERERGEYFAEFLTDALLRGDTKTRYEAHQIALLNGIKNRNEVRVQENMNPVRGGDEYRVPLNTEPAGSTKQEGDDAQA